VFRFLKIILNLFLTTFWALTCVGKFTGLNLFEPELDLNQWSGPGFENLPELNPSPVLSSWKMVENWTELDFSNTSHRCMHVKLYNTHFILWILTGGLLDSIQGHRAAPGFVHHAAKVVKLRQLCGALSGQGQLLLEVEKLVRIAFWEG
jgi:hypothetical protein